MIVSDSRQSAALCRLRTNRLIQPLLLNFVTCVFV